MLPFIEPRACVGLSVKNLRMENRGSILTGCGFSRNFIAGKVHEICEPNGAGKSTLLKIIAGLQICEAGKISTHTHGTDSETDCMEIQDLMRAKIFSWLPPADDYRLSSHVHDVVVAGRWRFHRGKPGAADRHFAQAILEALGISELGRKDVITLSSGQKRRVSLARTLIQDADVVLLDEPFNGLDVSSHDVVRHTIETVADRGRTIICAHPGKSVWTTCV